MRYDPSHKARSRERIVEAARASIRRDGPDVSIDAVMAAAGLTRGAFYAHFKSKRALLREVMGLEAGLVRAVRAAVAEPEPMEPLRVAFRFYLSPEERDDVARGCPLVSHPVDAIRGEASMREDYGAQLGSLIGPLETVLDHQTARVIATLAVGGGLLGAAGADRSQGDELARACLAQIEALLS